MRVNIKYIIVELSPHHAQSQGRILYVVNRTRNDRTHEMTVHSPAKRRTIKYADEPTKRKTAIKWRLNR